MFRHVVLLRRDPSLVLALRALLHGTGRVTELPSIQAWSALPPDDIDAVVIDLPVPRRKQAINLVRSRFNGRLVLVLEPNDDPAAVPTDHACSVVQRPFEIVELWHLVTTDPTPTRSGAGQEGPTAPAETRPTAPERPTTPAPSTRDAAPSSSPAAAAQPGPAAQPPRPAAQQRGPAATGSGPAAPEQSGPAAATREPGPRAAAPPAREDDAASKEPSPTRPADRRATPAPQSSGEPHPSAAEASTWRWRGRRYGPATAIPPDPPGGQPGVPGAATTPGQPARPSGLSAPAAAAGGPRTPPAAKDPTSAKGPPA